LIVKSILLRKKSDKNFIFFEFPAANILIIISELISIENEAN